MGNLSRYRSRGSLSRDLHREFVGRASASTPAGNGSRSRARATLERLPGQAAAAAPLDLRPRQRIDLTLVGTGEISPARKRSWMTCKPEVACVAPGTIAMRTVF